MVSAGRVNRTKRRNEIFSPIFATFSFTTSPRGTPPSPGRSSASSTSFGSFPFTAAATVRTNSRKSSVLATKSVSQFTSTSAADPGATWAATTPSDAILDAFFAAAARPFLRSTSTAVSMSPPDSVRAFLQSIIPAPVFSRSSRTISAVICILFLSWANVGLAEATPPRRRVSVRLRSPPRLPPRWR